MVLETSKTILRFENFTIDLRTRELRRQSNLIKLQDLPLRLLILLTTRAGELVTREEIERELWGESHFVDFEHGINTAMRKVRDALGDNLEVPRFIETLPRKGYRFIAQVSREDDSQPIERAMDTGAASENAAATAGASEQSSPVPTAASREFALPMNPARKLFLITQAGYLFMYCAVLFHLDESGRLLNLLLNVPATKSLPVLIALAVSGVAVRLFLFTSVALSHPDAGIKYRRLFPIVFLLDIVWAAAPLLLFEKIGMGLAMASIAGLAYLPFSQRILMGSIYRPT